MGIDDKAENATNKHLGKAKEAFGDATGNDDLRAEGQADQAKGHVGEAAEKAKDVAGDIGSNLKAAAQKIKEGFSNK
ncbi:CsbD family protein [Pseudarthrobacter sp. PS3-L1]|uniref:CsbD family protein n=1 Tax=Pseudarthrobacter sp. PS3-L1 TaxID=3046207 RepID=UPI0024B92766|nr:CsbD family protein [Pseudarthrobacter sp. PS3-L1]MDJ0320827.1 CsbD family protein [Pseudarthrobacter sp. PS3-L1]